MVGKGPYDIKWSVAKDGGDVDQLSGATITSRSLLFAINSAMDIWKNSKEKIISAKKIDIKETCHGR
jgi:Na+-translocating ferredoxin:NAD+ oxidoreductase RnfG subunit